MKSAARTSIGLSLGLYPEIVLAPVTEGHLENLAGYADERHRLYLDVAPTRLCSQ